MINLIFISLMANAACEKLYAKKDSDGFWDVTERYAVGYNEVVLTPKCKIDFEVAELVGGKWVMNSEMRALKNPLAIKTLEARLQKLEEDNQRLEKALRALAGL